MVLCSLLCYRRRRGQQGIAFLNSAKNARNFFLLRNDLPQKCLSQCCGHADIIAASSSAAQLLITALFKVVKTAQPSALPPVRDALALCFERQPRSAAYVGALQRLAIEDRGGAVDPAEVASAAVQSGSLQSGTLQVLIKALRVACRCCVLSLTDDSASVTPVKNHTLHGPEKLQRQSYELSNCMCCSFWQPIMCQCHSTSAFTLLWLLQLEEAMLFGKQPRKAEAEPAAKRKHSAASVSGEPEVATDEATWAALAEVYMRLGESHLAHVACIAHLARWGMPLLAHSVSMLYTGNGHKSSVLALRGILMYA